jgi:hypothetical protein
MKKSFLTVVNILIIVSIASSQRRLVVLNHKGCGFVDGIIPKEISTMPPGDQALEYVKAICSVAGIEQNFVVKEGAVSIAMSTTNDQKERLIIYNEDFFGNQHNDTYKIAILAHEIGHHLNNHLFPETIKRSADELSADKFSGFIIAKLGLKLEDGITLLKTACPLHVEGYYPARSDRIQAFTNGFKDAQPDVNPDINYAYNIKNLLYKIKFGSSYVDVLNFEQDNNVSRTYDSLPQATECTGEIIRYYWKYVKKSKIWGDFDQFFATAGLIDLITNDTFVVYAFKNNALSRVSIRIFTSGNGYEKKILEALGQNIIAYPIRYQTTLNGFHFISGSSFHDRNATEIYICNEIGYKFCLHDWWHF